MFKQRNRFLIGGVLPALLVLGFALLRNGWAQDENKEQDGAKASQLIQALGAESQEERDRAYEELRALGEDARAALVAAAGAENQLVRDNVQRLLDALAQEPRERLRLKERPERAAGEEGAPLPRFPRLGPGAPGQRDWDQWNQDLEQWQAELDRWLNETMQRQGGQRFRFGFPGLGAGATGTFGSHRQDESGSYTYELEIDAEGRVTAKVEREVNGEKTEETYQADSLEEFQRAHPEVAGEMGLDTSAFDWPAARGFGWRGGVPRAERPALPEPPQLDEPRPLQGARLGVQVRELLEDDPLRFQVALDPGVGLLVVEVVPGSLAEELGVSRHDIIVRVAEQPVGTVGEVRAALREADLGALEITVLRQGREQLLRRGA
ncbi:MAG: PDZ domain-containing protein [Planctomycetes bacterium]|nr:PDZ domain-containing protein [Planctomycetota bacterium]